MDRWFWLCIIKTAGDGKAIGYCPLGNVVIYGGNTVKCDDCAGTVEEVYIADNATFGVLGFIGNAVTVSRIRSITQTHEVE